MYYFKFRNYIAIDMIWKFNPTDVFILILAMIYRLTVSWKKGKKKKCPLQEKRGLPSQFLLQWGEIISEVLIAFLHLTRCSSEEITSNYYYFHRNLDLRVQSVPQKRALGFKICRCKRSCPKDLRVCAPAAPMLTHSLKDGSS